MAKNRIARIALILLVLLLIVVSFISIYNLNDSETNTIEVINKTETEFEKIQVIFDSDNGNGNSKVDIYSNNNITIPPNFEGSISLIIGLNGTTKRYILKGYYGTYENEYIQCEINCKGNVNELSDLYVEVK